MKEVALKKYEFEYRGMSRLKALSGISRATGFHCREENHRFSMEHAITSRCIEIETSKEGFRTVAMKRNQFEKDETILKTLFGILDRQNLNSRKRSDKFQISRSSKGRNHAGSSQDCGYGIRIQKDINIKSIFDLQRLSGFR